MEVICSPPLVPPCTKQQEPPMAPCITVHLMAFPSPETTLGETANLVTASCRIWTSLAP